MSPTPPDEKALARLKQAARTNAIDLRGAKVRRTAARFCLGVEHGDYNGTDLFGVAVDRFIWMAYRPSGGARMRLFSENFPADGVVEFSLDRTPPPPPPGSPQTWAPFAQGAAYTLTKAGFPVKQGIDAVIYGNIPGGGMSRSASLTLNLILTLLEVNSLQIDDPFEIVRLAQAVENDYIGSPCGMLDQIMILFARPRQGAHYHPRTAQIRYVPLGAGGDDLRLVVLDTGTVRPGLQNSTYKLRRAECEQLVRLLQKDGYRITTLADVKDKALYDQIMQKLSPTKPNLAARLNYIYHAQQRFYQMLSAWRHGDIDSVGRLFRQDGIALRDDYAISGPELETMCQIARTTPGVLGERMLGGGDKGAAGALVRADAVETLKTAVKENYPRRYPDLADKYAVHVCKIVAGVSTFDQWF